MKRKFRISAKVVDRWRYGKFIEFQISDSQCYVLDEDSAWRAITVLQIALRKLRSAKEQQPTPQGQNAQSSTSPVA
jgi:hypothetical protein